MNTPTYEQRPAWIEARRARFVSGCRLRGYEPHLRTNIGAQGYPCAARALRRSQPYTFELSLGNYSVEQVVNGAILLLLTTVGIPLGLVVSGYDSGGRHASFSRPYLRSIGDVVRLISELRTNCLSAVGSAASRKKHIHPVQLRYEILTPYTNAEETTVFKVMVSVMFAALVTD